MRRGALGAVALVIALALGPAAAWAQVPTSTAAPTPAAVPTATSLAPRPLRSNADLEAAVSSDAFLRERAASVSARSRASGARAVGGVVLGYGGLTLFTGGLMAGLAGEKSTGRWMAFGGLSAGVGAVAILAAVITSPRGQQVELVEAWNARHPEAPLAWAP